MNLADIGRLVHARRTALGLSQARLAALSGLSRATINQLETGALVDLGAAKLIALMDLVGINLDAIARQGQQQALKFAPMATPNCSTYGRSNCSRQDGTDYAISGLIAKRAAASFSR